MLTLENATPATRAVVARMYELYSEGRIEEAAGNLHPEVDWAIQVPRHLFSFAGPRHGREKVLEAFLEIQRDYEFLSYAPNIVIADGPHAAAHVRCVVRHRETGHGTNLELCAIMRVEDGLITWFREFVDSASVAVMLSGAGLTLGKAA